MTESEMYRAAADLLRRDGWCKGTHMDRFGKRCIAGALDSTTGNAIKRWSALLDVADGYTRYDVTVFNDKHCKTIDDACAALEIAADLAS